MKGRSVKSQLASVPACQRAVKKAIVQRLLKAHHVEVLPESGETYTVEVAIVKDEAVLSLDTTGAGLHKRGYRKLVGEAPLRETLAAAMILLSFWRPERPLIDPFCGSGTIPIEAVRIARNIAPGLLRSFAAESWTTFPADAWSEARTEAHDLIKPALTERVIGQDIDPKALDMARYHARLAGVEQDIHFQCRSFEELSSKREYGCVITNPPYAHRMGEWEEVREIYEAIPHVLRRLKTWSHYILTAFPDFEQLVGQGADRRRKLYNSRIECTLYQFYGPRPPRGLDSGESDTTEHIPEKRVATKPAGPAFGGITDKAREQAELFASRLRKTARHLRRWPTKQGITCYRLYDRDIPEIPLVVDRYEDRLHMAEYDRPHTRTPAEHADWLDLMAATAAKELEITRANTYLKRRQRQKGADQYGRVADAEETAIVSEGGLRFLVNLSDYLDTGLFLDHRITRDMVRADANGRRVLNLFAYTGSFTVYAAAGGAVSTTTVDLSANYLEWAQENLRLNRLFGPLHETVRADAVDFVRSLPRRPIFDMAIIDPPTFSNSKRMEDDWDVARHHAPLLNDVIQRLASGGIIYFSTNFRRFKLDEDSLRGVTIREITRQTIPADFRNKRIHRCWKMVKQDDGASG